MSVPDRAYTTLLTHLHNPTSPLSFSTIQNALAHHLASLSPLPTPLAATAVSSPLYLSQPLTNAKLQSLSTAFRHATHLKFRALRETAKARSRAASLFGKSIQVSTGEWVHAVVAGIQGGHPVLKLACCSGLLLGIQDLKDAAKAGSGEGLVDVGNARGSAEEELILALAEVIDMYTYEYTSGAEGWEKEFQSAGQDILSLALITSSQSLPLVDQHRLKALPLPILARILTSTISSTFAAGTFLSTLSSSITPSPQYKINIYTSSPLSLTLQSLSSSPLMTSIASISKLTAIVFGLLLSSTAPSHLQEGLRAASFALNILRDMAIRVESDWSTTVLASAKEEDIAPGSRDLTKSVWTILKTLLFSNIMLADAILSAVVYIPPSLCNLSIGTPTALALQTLHTLSNLSFVISQFGGVTSTSQGFEELKKTFYLALDILAQGDSGSEILGVQADAFVRESCLSLRELPLQQGAPLVRHAKQAYVLASIEQLVPVLSEETIKDWVWGFCYPHLSDSSHRETYESAHSVVLSIFASTAQRQHHSDHTASLGTKTILLGGRKKPIFDDQLASPQIPTAKERGNTAGEEAPAVTASTYEKNRSANFINKMVPFYAQCLIDNSVDGKLSTAQLQLAYAALVRSASTSSISIDATPDETYALAWYCIETLLEAIRGLSYDFQIQDAPKGKGNEDGNEAEERLHRLQLMLISTVSSLPLPLMLRALEQIRMILAAFPKGHFGARDEESAKDSRRKELAQALFNEILEKVGDREKEAAMQWWYKHRRTISQGQEDNIIMSATGSQGEAIALDTPRGHSKEQTSGNIIPRL